MNSIDLDLHKPVRITTERLVLREFEAGDGQTIAAYLAEPDVSLYLLPGQAEAEHVMAMVKAAIEHARLPSRTYYGLGITLKSEGGLIGTCVLADAAVGGVANIGWDLDKRYWGRGIMTEAAKAAMDFAFETLQVRGIQTQCFPANRASIRVMEKVGMQRQKLTLWQEWKLRRHYQERRRMVSYSLLHPDWKQSKGWL